MCSRRAVSTTRRQKRSHECVMSLDDGLSYIDQRHINSLWPKGRVAHWDIRQIPCELYTLLCIVALCG